MEREEVREEKGKRRQEETDEKRAKREIMRDTEGVRQGNAGKWT